MLGKINLNRNFLRLNLSSMRSLVSNKTDKGRDQSTGSKISLSLKNFNSTQKIMAQFFPELSQIPRLHQPATEGELYLLNFLANNLDDTYEVYFQPFLNGDRPDVVLMRRGSGVMIIEVKDWNLKHYRLDERKNWEVTNNGNTWSKILSPISQVIEYKENLFNLHIENLLEKYIYNSNMWSFVVCGVYFHNESKKNLESFLTKDFKDDKKYLKFLGYQEIWGKDSLNPEYLKERLSKRYLSKRSYLFDEELYNSFRRYLNPPLHIKEEGKELIYSPEQRRFIESEIGQKKIRGSAGSGKTYVLAKRAVNALKRMGTESYYQHPPVLILTFNITLKNYIHDRISEVREDFSWKNFHINNYHNFITAELNNLGIKLLIPEDFDSWDNNNRSEYFENSYYANIEIFRRYSEKIHKYDVIFIDEIQDYKKEWVQIIRECFLSEQGEFVVFGDEKQNIYERNMDSEKKPYTGIGGNWNLLRISYRLSSKLADLATQFQGYYFENKYSVEPIEFVRQTNLLYDLNAINFKSFTNENMIQVYSFISDKIKEYNIHPNDVCVQSSTISILRKADLYFRLIEKQKTDTTFESEELHFVTLLQLLHNTDHKSLSLIKEKWSQLKDIFSSNISDEKIIEFFCYSSTYLSVEFSKDFINALKQNHSFSQQDYQRWFYDVKSFLRDLSYNKVLKKIFDGRLDKIRSNKKLHFWMNSGKIKISTIHSFKGLEASTLFLIFDNESQGHDFTIDELVYTAITRCRGNLFIIDLGSKYSDFFSRAISSPSSSPSQKNNGELLQEANSTQKDIMTTLKENYQKSLQEWLNS